MSTNRAILQDVRKPTLPMCAAFILLSIFFASTPAIASAVVPRFRPTRPVDEERVRAAGIRSIAGRQLTLYTDLPENDELRDLTAAFDLAVPQWCEYFKIPPEQMADWHAHGFLMVSRERFRRAGLLPADLPEFRHGYTFGSDFWLMEQPSDYYRRHLLLHEGTHSFMFSALGSCGPPWYMEGMAELFGTHRLDGQTLTLRYMPANRDETPMLGRIRMIREAVAAERGLTLSQIFNYDSRAHLENEPYAWCWAAAKFLDTHPRYRERFRSLVSHVQDGRVPQRVAEMFGSELDAALADEWRLFISGLDYGYDIESNAIDFVAGEPLSGDTTEVEIRADRGWQSAKILVEAGQAYHLAAAGRYQIADQPRPWICEPGGVTIRYFGGQPLGKLLAAVHFAEGSPNRAATMIRPWPIGLRGEIVPPESGTLYLKINDAPGELSDNTGTLKVVVDR